MTVYENHIGSAVSEILWSNHQLALAPKDYRGNIELFFKYWEYTVQLTRLLFWKLAKSKEYLWRNVLV